MMRVSRVWCSAVEAVVVVVLMGTARRGAQAVRRSRVKGKRYKIWRMARLAVSSWVSSWLLALGC